MPTLLADRVQETTTVTGTGSATLLGAVSGFQSFSVIGNGNSTYYSIVNGSEWEIGLGTYSTTGPTLSRDTVYSNSLGTTAKINFSAGTKNVFITYTAQSANTTLSPQTLTINNNNAVLAVVNNINGALGNPSTGGWLLPQAVTLSSLSGRLSVPAKTSLGVRVDLRYSTNYSYTGSTVLKTLTINPNTTNNFTVAVTNTLPAQSTLYLDITRVGNAYPGAGLTIQIAYKYV
jgi:hypothetical protein